MSALQEIKGFLSRADANGEPLYSARDADTCALYLLWVLADSDGPDRVPVDVRQALAAFARREGLPDHPPHVCHAHIGSLLADRPPPEVFLRDIERVVREEAAADQIGAGAGYGARIGAVEPIPVSAAQPPTAGVRLGSLGRFALVEPLNTDQEGGE